MLLNQGRSIDEIEARLTLFRRWHKVAVIRKIYREVENLRAG